MCQSNSLRMSVNSFAARLFEVKEVWLAIFAWLDCDWLWYQPALTTCWRLFLLHDENAYDMVLWFMMISNLPNPFFPALAGNCSFLRVTYSIGWWHGSWNCVASAGTIAKTVWIWTICSCRQWRPRHLDPLYNIENWREIWRIMLLDSKCDMGLGSTLGSTSGCTSGCTLSHFALKTSPQERFRTVQNGSELLWGCLRMVFEALFDGVFVWFLILNPIPLLVYYLRSVLHLHSVLPLCGSTSGRRFSLIYCGLFAGICYLMSRKKISKHLQTSESK